MCPLHDWHAVPNTLKAPPEPCMWNAGQAAAEVPTPTVQQAQPSATSSQQPPAMTPKAAAAAEQGQVAAAALPPQSPVPQQQGAADLDNTAFVSAHQPAQGSRELRAGMAVQQSSSSQQSALPEELLERLNGLASQDELQELRDKLSEVLEQLHQIDSQQHAIKSPDAVPSFSPGAGKMWIDVSADAVQSPRFAAAGSPIFASAPGEQSPRGQGARRQQAKQVYQQQVEHSPEASTLNHAIHVDAQTEAPEASMAFADPVQPLKVKPETIDRASSAAPGWNMETRSLGAEKDAAEQAPAVSSQAASIEQATSTGTRQPQQQARQGSKIQIQAPTGNRIRTAAFQKQPNPQQKHEQADFSLRLEPVSPGPQTLLVSTPDKSTPAGQHVPATVQMVLGSSDPVAARQVVADTHDQAQAAVIIEQPVSSSTASLEAYPEYSSSMPSSIPADKLDAGQRLIVDRALVPQQAIWIQRPKTAASGGGNSGDGQEAITVEQLAASLQTVAAVTHAMALGPPTQATSASSQVTSRLFDCLLQLSGADVLFREQ